MDDIKPVALIIGEELWERCATLMYRPKAEIPEYAVTKNDFLASITKAREEGRLKGLREASEALLIICRASEGK